MASSPRAPVNPDVLRWAREIAGYDIEDVARRLGAKPPRVAAWETGEALPTLSQVRTLADLYRRPPAFFFLVEPPPPDLPAPPDFRSSSPATNHGPSVELRRELRAVVQRRDLLARLAELPGPFTVSGVDTADPIACAGLMRDRLGVSVQDQFAAPDAYRALALWVRGVEALGVIVFQTGGFPLAEARGVSVYFNNSPIVLLNAKDAITARAFTLLHELFHLMRGSGGLCDLHDADVERDCNRFAAEILMPWDAFLGEFRDGNISEVVPALANRFKVSIEAAAVRLATFGRLSQIDLARIRQETAARVQAKEAGQSAPVPFWRKRLRDLGRPYVGTVLDAYYTEELTLTEVSQYLGVKVPQVRQIEEAMRQGQGIAS